jgi:hypothetical protein
MIFVLCIYNFGLCLIEYFDCTLLDELNPMYFGNQLDPSIAGQQHPGQLLAVSQNRVANLTECLQTYPVYRARPVTFQSVADFKVSQILLQRISLAGGIGWLRTLGFDFFDLAEAQAH